MISPPIALSDSCVTARWKHRLAAARGGGGAGGTEHLATWGACRGSARHRTIRGGWSRCSRQPERHNYFQIILKDPSRIPQAGREAEAEAGRLAGHRCHCPAAAVTWSHCRSHQDWKRGCSSLCAGTWGHSAPWLPGNRRTRAWVGGSRSGWEPPAGLWTALPSARSRARQASTPRPLQPAGATPSRPPCWGRGPLHLPWTLPWPCPGLGVLGPRPDGSRRRRGPWPERLWRLPGPGGYVGPTAGPAGAAPGPGGWSCWCLHEGLTQDPAQGSGGSVHAAWHRPSQRAGSPRHLQPPEQAAASPNPEPHPQRAWAGSRCRAGSVLPASPVGGCLGRAGHSRLQSCYLKARQVQY